MPKPIQTTIDATITAFPRSLSGANKRPATITAYRTDLSRFARFLGETNCTIASPAAVTRADVSEYLAHLGEQGLIGITRARKLASIREFFRSLEEQGLVLKNPRLGVQTPQRQGSCGLGDGARDWHAGTRSPKGEGAVAVSEAETIEGAIDKLTKNEITEEEVRLAARRAFTFLSACVEGQIADAKVGDRIMAARSLLEHAARLPDLLGELSTIADLASEDDVAVIVSALD